MTTTTTAQTSATTKGRIYGLDLIRGAAVLLVLLRHAWPNTFGGAGIVGVTMFFALSGYLITGLLARDILAFGRVRYLRFYIHRALRLFPALAFMLAGFGVIEGIWNIRGDREEIVRSVLVGLTYTMNVPGFDHGSDAVSHLWTLATEEQFYLVWPLVLIIGFRLKKPGLVTVLGIVGVTLLCAATIYIAPSIESVYNLPTSWFATMMLGALAFLYKDPISHLLRPRVGVTASVVSAVVLVALTLMPEMKDSAATYLIVGPVIAVCTVVLILHASRYKGLAPRVANPLLGLGAISYAAYLWNLPVSAWLGEGPLSLQAGVLSIAITVAAATVSWFLVEKPVSRLRPGIDRRMEVSTEITGK